MHLFAWRINSRFLFLWTAWGDDEDGGGGGGGARTAPSDGGARWRATRRKQNDLHISFLSHNAATYRVATLPLARGYTATPPARRVATARTSCCRTCVARRGASRARRRLAGKSACLSPADMPITLTTLTASRATPRHSNIGRVGEGGKSLAADAPVHSKGGSSSGHRTQWLHTVISENRDWRCLPSGSSLGDSAGVGRMLPSMPRCLCRAHAPHGARTAHSTATGAQTSGELIAATFYRDAAPLPAHARARTLPSGAHHLPARTAHNSRLCAQHLPGCCACR